MSEGNGQAKNGGGLHWVGTRSIRPDGVDKVTGRANFGADFFMPGMLTGRVLRSPHPHARIRSIDASKALALPGVKAVVTCDDMPDIPAEEAFVGEGPMNFRDLSRNCLARGKALYDGHAVAAVAATTAAIAEQALGLIEVDYEVLPHVIDVEAAMRPDAPVLHDDVFTQGVDPAPTRPSNVAKRVQTGHGDLDAGFAAADVVVERHFTTKPVHQGYIEPHACVASVSEDGQTTIWGSSQGHFMIRAYVAKLLAMDISEIRVIPAEIGGGFGGKTLVYLEPVAVLLSRKSGRPVKMVMSREEVFRATGPTSGTAIRVKIGAKKDGTITAAEAECKYQAGGFPGSQVHAAAMTGFACYSLANVRIIGWDVCVNRPRCAAYRAPGAPMAAFAIESTVDEVAEKIGIDPIDLRLKNAAKSNSQSSYGPQFREIGYIETLKAAKEHPHYKAPLGPNQGRGIASGFWFNIGGESSAAINVNEDGTAVVATGSPDIGGSRASMALMAAEVLGIDQARIRPIVADTASIGYTFLTGGSRVTFATGMAVVESAKQVVQQLRERAAKIWDIDVDAVEWKDGEARPAGSNAGRFEPLSLKDLAAMAGKTGGPIIGRSALNAQGAGPGFGTHICDVEIDRETGKVTIVRYTAVQDVGKAIHPSYVEGQIQGGVAQGIGWALNEEYIYGDDGRLQNPGFLDYRMPVASDLPMIDAVMVEVPNPAHPYGARGVGEVPIVPPMAAVANAIYRAGGVRMPDLPMSPPRLLAALDGD
ncbi:MAG: xanthine dehydrogenase family protein molybdopterin-binding subunit [Ectothiorhodospiraceae bacterium]|nr:xanthine dehydrogenase family protein molybdopterin-binding subunit [Chromatiales bacterium]MCP5156278.1 xanthine dehydrogenase family protein molybdopterin-binding subunit [Ectothiorhodospiraceae bacterium]